MKLSVPKVSEFQMQLSKPHISHGLFATSTEKPMLAVEYHSRVLEVLNWGHTMANDRQNHWRD
jgi:hypothetical protein